MLSRVSELSFQSGVIFRRDCRILRVLSSEKTVEIQATISSLGIWKSVKLQSSAARTSTELDQMEAVRGLPYATPRQHTLDILWILGQHHASMHCAYFFQKPFRYRKLVTPRDELQNLLIHILLVASNCFPRSILFCMFKLLRVQSS